MQIKHGYAKTLLKILKEALLSVYFIRYQCIGKRTATVINLFSQVSEHGWKNSFCYQFIFSGFNAQVKEQLLLSIYFIRYQCMGKRTATVINLFSQVSERGWKNSFCYQFILSGFNARVKEQLLLSIYFIRYQCMGERTALLNQMHYYRLGSSMSAIEMVGHLNPKMR